MSFSSILRFCARAASVPSGLTGRYSPKPAAASRSGGKPSVPVMYLTTDSARLALSSQLPKNAHPAATRPARSWRTCSTDWPSATRSSSSGSTALAGPCHCSTCSRRSPTFRPRSVHFRSLGDPVDIASPRRKDDRLPTLVAAMRAERPDVTLQEMCDMLEEMRVPTPRGHASWYPSSVKAFLDWAERMGLASLGTLATSRGNGDQDATSNVAGS